MSEPSGSLLYEQIVEVTREYLGPAADRFITRQITNHLNKVPDDLLPADIPPLIDWLKLSMAFLTNDQAMIARYASELQSVAMAAKSGRVDKRPKDAKITSTGRTVVGGKSKA